jgi:hypothetical protein
VKERLGVSFVTASKLVEQIQRLVLLRETTGARRNRRYRYTPYLALFEELEAGPIEAGALHASREGH